MVSLHQDCNTVVQDVALYQIAQYMPKKQERSRGPLLFLYMWGTDSNPFNAARMSAAGEGSTEPLNNYLRRRKCKSSPVSLCAEIEPVTGTKEARETFGSPFLCSGGFCEGFVNFPDFEKNSLRVGCGIPGR